MYHCTRTSRADEVKLAENVANLVAGGPCRTEKCNDSPIGILQLRSVSGQRVEKKFKKLTKISEFEELGRHRYWRPSGPLKRRSPCKARSVRN